MRDPRYLNCMGRTRRKPRTPYGEWLLYLRSKNKMTQDQVKLELIKYLPGWSNASAVIADWESDGLPARDVVIALAQVYGVSIETLLAVERTGQGKYTKLDKLVKEKIDEDNRAREAEIKGLKEKIEALETQAKQLKPPKY